MATAVDFAIFAADRREPGDTSGVPEARRGPPGDGAVFCGGSVTSQPVTGRQIRVMTLI